MKKLMKYSLILAAVLTMAAFVVMPAFADDPLPPVEPTVPLNVDNFPLLTSLIVGAVTFVVTLGVKSISKTFGVDISGKASAITGAVVLTLIEFINKLLSTVPIAYVPMAAAGIGFIISIFSAYGLAGLLKKFTTQPDAAEKILPPAGMVAAKRA